VNTDVDIIVELEQPRKISTVRFQIVEAKTSELLAEGTARVLFSPSQPPPIGKGGRHKIQLLTTSTFYFFDISKFF